MGLCQLCKSIDFANLPEPAKGSYGTPSIDEKYRLAEERRKRHPSYKYPSGSKFEDGPGHYFYFLSHKKDKDSFAIPHHQSTTDLENAAFNCDLCKLLLEPVRKLEKNIRDVNSYAVLYKPHQPSRYWISKTTSSSYRHGFLFWTQTKRQRMYFLGTIIFTVSDNSKLAPYIPGRLIEQDPASGKCWSRINRWVTHCDKNHAEFALAGPLPTRILDLGETTDSKIKLVEKKGLIAKYITLSYQWGGKVCLITERKTLAERLADIPWEILPQTFKDTVIICRHLKIRYLWIDSLCIIQGDADDWQIEAAQMGEYYSKAYLTISASAAANPLSGCFHQRETPQYIQLPYTSNKISSVVHASLVPFESGEFSHQIDILENEPISARGWTFQERVLSHRTLYYATKQLYFECMTEVCTEDGFQSDDRILKVDKQAKEELLDLWDTLAENYGDRALTFMTDKLPAISGIAAFFNGQLDDTYLAGLWKSTLPGSLLWTSNKHREEWPSTPLKSPSPYRAPSWSWASLGSFQAAEEGDTSSEMLATVISTSITVPGEKLNKYGQVTDGKLELKAPPLIPVHVFQEDNPLIWEDSMLQVGRGESIGCYWDYKFSRETLKRFSLYILVIGSWPWNSTILYPSLIITSELNGSGNYRRMGMVLPKLEQLGKKHASESDVLRQTVILI